MRYTDETDAAADYEAEMAMEEEMAGWTAEQWEQFELEQDAAARVRAEQDAERGMNFGIGWHLEEPDYRR